MIFVLNPYFLFVIVLILVSLLYMYTSDMQGIMWGKPNSIHMGHTLLFRKQELISHVVQTQDNLTCEVSEADSYLEWNIVFFDMNERAK